MAEVHFVDVSKAYGDSEIAVRDLSLTIEDGEFFVLLGPSGCGKSTLLKMVAGLEGVTDGEIYIDRELINYVPPGRRGVAMVFQNYALYPHMTVRQNIGFPLKMAKTRRDRIEGPPYKRSPRSWPSPSFWNAPSLSFPVANGSVWRSPAH